MSNKRAKETELQRKWLRRYEATFEQSDPSQYAKLSKAAIQTGKCLRRIEELLEWRQAADHEIWDE